jgi:hypothetical protein
MASLTALSPAEVSARIEAGKALLVDIREADEVARERIAGSVATPLSMFEAAHLDIRPGFWGLSAFVGAGLFMAGATGFCGMARLLAVMPWNRAMRAA